jgi:uncharacterized protein (UPF0332 family)
MREENKLAWCLKQAKGLKKINPNKNLVQAYLKKSRSALNMLDAAIEKEELEWVLDTSYYAKYFVIYALFMKSGIKCEIHDCTINALRVFVEQGLIPLEIYDELEKSKELRVNALYYNKEFGKEEIMLRAKKAPEFCLKVEEVIKKINEEELIKIRNRIFQEK